MSASARSGSTLPTTRKSSTTGRHTACSASAQTSGSGRKPGSQGGLKPLPLGRAIPGAPGLFSRSCVIRSFVRGGSVLVLALALGACALTLDSTHLGVPVSLAAAAQRPDSGTPFRVTKHAIYLLLGLVPVAQPNLEDVLAGQGGTRTRLTNLRVKGRSRWSDLLITRLTLGVVVPRSVTFEGVGVGQ